MKLIAQNSARVWGGNEKSLATLARGLRSRGHEVALSCHPGDVRKEFEGLGFRVTTIRPRGVADVFSALRFSSWLKAERPDALLLTSWVPTLPGAWAAHLAKVPRVIVRQGIVRDFPQSPPRRFAFNHWINAVMVNSEEIRERWLATSPSYPAERVHVVLNGIESRQHDRERLRAQLRAELGVNSQALLIGAAGHLSARKGFDLLLRAFSRARILDARLVVLGDGGDMPSLKALADELHLTDRIHWLGRREKGDEIIAGYDVFVLSSRNEGMANVMLEAMAAAVPVVAVDVSGVRTALGPTGDRPIAGWTVAPDDREIAAALREVSDALRSKPQAITARIGEAQWRVENWFSVERMIDESEGILFG